MLFNNTFNFSHVTMNDVLKELRSINIRMTTGCDLIPGKLIKEGADFLCKPIPSLINKCIDTCTFPNTLKLADVVPIFKKNMLNKMNYRPISILSCISKIFEKLLISQLRMYFDDIFSQYLLLLFASSSDFFPLINPVVPGLDRRTPRSCLLAYSTV